TASVGGSSKTLAVPMVSPVWKAKEITYQVSDGLRYEYYDLLADSIRNDGTLVSVGADGSVNVSARDLGEFRWKFDGTKLVNDTSGGNHANALVSLAGSVNNGQFTGVRYQLSQSLQLLHDKAWAVEVQLENWKGSSGSMILSTTPDSKDGTPFFYFRPADYFVGIGMYNGTTYDNYGISLKKLGLLCSEGTHTYRFENRIGENGSNMVYLIVDNKEIGTLTDHYINSTLSDSQNHGLSGKDFSVSYFGNSNAPINGCKVNYITVEETGEHTYKNGSCTECGAEHPNLSNYEDKVVSVLGDSISTFAGYIPVADGFNLEHLTRYPQDNLLTDVNETWWMQVINELGAKLGINDSWRGATVSGAASVTSGVAGEKASMANLTRIQNLGSNGTPDVILFYGGTNDLAHVSKVGTFDASTAPTAVDLTTAKWDNLADGYVHTLLRLKHYYPDAEIVAMLPTYTASYYTTTKLAEANAVLAEICEHYGVAYVDLRDCGISAADLPDGIHPGAKGMDYITDAVIETLLADCEVEAGDHVVHSIKHNLTNVSATLGHWKGISSGERFVETLTGNGSLTVTVTMGGKYITSDVYENGVITIPAVTGDLVITAKTKFSLGSHLQQLPEEFCSGVNLWTELEHDKYYYTEKDGWGINSLGTVYSIT
ncbi:MAG: hypothetical protein IJM99_10250, partial [Firmicutes bacterium]|nr:hypothetical protein [Bacillota bacterium]